MSINEQRIREYAYQIWESEGRPNGQSERHWAMACTLAQTQMESEIAGNDEPQTASTEPIEPISPTQPAQPVTPSDPIQPTDPVQPAQPVQPGSPTARVAEGEAATKKTRSKTAQVDEVISRVAANEKAAAKKKSAGTGELNTDVKFKTDFRKTDSTSESDPQSETQEATAGTKRTTKPRKTKALENELS